ncbi:MAG: tetratricopeptide repeat protein [Thermodesulfobacteriota bacterium]
MNNLSNRIKVLLIVVLALGVFSLDSFAQSTAIESYKKGREAFHTFTPQGFQSAITYYNQAIAADPNYAPAYAGLGEVYSFQGWYRYLVKDDYEKFYIDSYENMKKALKINPNLPSVQLALAYSYYHLSDEKRAIQTAQKVLSKDPNNAEALYILWAAEGSNPNNPNIKKALEIDPNLVPAIIGLGTAYYQKRQSFRQAETYYRRAAEIAPSPQLYNFLGNSLTYQGYYTQAIAQFQNALKLDPNYAAAYMNMGIALFYMNKLPESIAAEQKAISLNPNRPDAYYFIAQSYDRSKNTAQAITYYKKFLDISSGQDEYSIYVGRAQTRLAQLSGATTR